MLQISTGKFFDTKDTHDTIHRGVLYSNFHMLSGGCIKTQSGNLSPAARWGDIETFVCEVIERQPNVFAAGAILSVGPDAFIHDFAAVSSFSLQRLLTPDHDLAMRLLTAQRPPLGIPKLPRQYVSKIFDMAVRRPSRRTPLHLFYRPAKARAQIVLWRNEGDSTIRDGNASSGR
jgi:hypothetical protein